MPCWSCDECGWYGDTPERIELHSRAGEPFDLVVCPSCRCLRSSIVPACDEPGCRTPASCGTPTPDGGYKRHCHLHPPAAHLRAPSPSPDPPAPSDLSDPSDPPAASVPAAPTQALRAGPPDPPPP